MSPNDRQNGRLGRWSGFAGAILFVGVVWLVILPAVARLPTVREHVRRNREQGIDPSAMFYTEVGNIRGVRVSHDADGPTVSTMTIGGGG